MGIRIGVIGVGEPKVGTSRGLTLMDVFQNQGARVVAAFDVNFEHCQRALAQAPDCRVTTDWEQFLSVPMDAAIITSPVRFHARQAIDCLDRGISVLSEVLAAATLEDAQSLAHAAAASPAIYMMGENQVYLDEVELVKRLATDGLFGQIYYGEAAYLNDARHLYHRDDGSLSWWGRGEDDVYLTHALGPLLYIFDDRITQVAALAQPRTLLEGGLGGDFNHTMLMKTAKGRSIYLRADHASPRPPRVAYYAVQGEKGAYESDRGLGDQPKVSLAEVPVEFGAGTTWKWRPLNDFARKYIADRLDAPADVKKIGFGGSEYWMVREFLDCLQSKRRPLIDVCTGLDYSLPGILALESVRRGGQFVDVPDPRAWL